MPRPGWPRLRPGAELLDRSEDTLHIALSNHTVTFTTPTVTTIVKMLVEGMKEGLSADQLMEHASPGGGDASLAGYVLDMLDSSNCLYWSETDPRAEIEPDCLSNYFASIGETPAVVKMGLEAARPLVITSRSGYPSLADAMSAGGIEAEFLVFAPGAKIEDITGQMKSLRRSGGLIVSWDLAYRSPAARAVNEAAGAGFAILFGACEGLVGRIGPFVIPRATPCLECLNARLLSHAGGEELSCFQVYRLRHAHTLEESRPTHPVFRNAVAGFLVLELSQIILKKPPQTLGGVVEFALAYGTVVRRSVLKAPRCPACQVAKPPRFAWNATFSSPSVKGGAV